LADDIEIGLRLHALARLETRYSQRVTERVKVVVLAAGVLAKQAMRSQRELVDGNSRPEKSKMSLLQQRQGTMVPSLDLSWRAKLDFVDDC